MYILGLGGSLHDFSACLMRNNEIIVAIEEERITRQKHAVDKKKLQIALEYGQVWKYLQDLPKDILKVSIEYCLDYAQITYKDLDMVITTDSNLHLHYVKSFNHLVIINHHMAHIASAYYPSSFDEAAVLIIDGRGSKVVHKGTEGYETVTLAYANKTKIQIVDKVLGDSLGHFYEAITLALGFGILEEGKVMGLSAYGSERFVDELRKAFVIDNEKIRFVWGINEIKRYVRGKIDDVNEKDVFQVKADLAYAAQKNLELMILFYAQRLYEMTQCKNLCIAGGVALNSVANGMLYQRTPFKNLFIQPAAGDNGLSIGCAMYGAFYLNMRRI